MWTNYLNQVNESLFDHAVHAWLKLWFLPHTMMTKGTEVDQWISQFSLNGIKQATLCSNKD